MGAEHFQNRQRFQGRGRLDWTVTTTRLVSPPPGPGTGTGLAGGGGPAAVAAPGAGCVDVRGLPPSAVCVMRADDWPASWEWPAPPAPLTILKVLGACGGERGHDIGPGGAAGHQQVQQQPGLGRVEEPGADDVARREVDLRADPPGRALEH